MAQITKNVWNGFGRWKDVASDLIGSCVKVPGELNENLIPVGAYRWLTVVSAEDPDGTELLLEPSEHRAVAPYKEALFADGIPCASFRVESLDAEHDRLTRAGVEFVQAPMDAGPTRMAVLNDTCGNLIQLVEHED